MLKKILFAVLLPVLCECESLQESIFDVCKNRQIVSSPVYETIHARSQVQCAAACLNKKLCGSSNYMKSNKTCQLLRDITFYEDCENVGEKSTGKVLRRFVPRCIHGGQWNSTLSRCTACQFGFTGIYCGRHIIDCAEGRAIGYSGWHGILIQPINATKAFKVMCDFDWGGTTIERRGSLFTCEGWYTNFNRTWYQYKNGFGIVWCNYFIGLENLRLLTLQRRTFLKLQLTGTSRDDAKYLDFFIDSETNKYAMHYSSFTPGNSNPVGDGFGLGAPNASINHSPFCTPDRDCGSCATMSASGWWFNTACAEKTAQKFSTLAPDQVHEQLKAIIKDDGGIISITDNEAAVTRWMVAGHEAARLLIECDKK